MRTSSKFTSTLQRLLIIMFVLAYSVSAPGQNTETYCTITVNTDKAIAEVTPGISGINATNYTGNYTEDSLLMRYLSLLEPGLIRFPGGDASNMYFFNGLPDDLPESALTYNGEWTDFSDGSESLNWKLNTSGYYELLEKTGAKGLITINYAYARYGTGDLPVCRAASHAADWVRFDGGRTTYWEIGNESYACWEGGFRIDTTHNRDGQPEYISGSLYGKHFRIFADSMRAAAAEIGTGIKIGAVFADSDEVWDGSGKGITSNWNEQLSAELRREDGSNYADYAAVHSYFLNKGENQPEEIIRSCSLVAELKAYIHGKLNSAGVEQVPLGLTEWNVREPYQTTVPGALQSVAARCEMIKEGYLASCYFAIKDYWRDEHADFGMFSHHNPDLPESEPYPAYYHAYYLSKTLKGSMVAAEVSGDSPDLLCYATADSSDRYGIVILNSSVHQVSTTIEWEPVSSESACRWFKLEKSEDSNSRLEKIKINGISNDLKKGGPMSGFENIAPFEKTVNDGTLGLELEGLGTVYLVIQPAERQPAGERAFVAEPKPAK